MANGNGFTKLESIEHVESVPSFIKDTLADGETLKISGFGNFVVKEKNDRRGRNPLTGEDLTIGARRVLTVKPSAMLKDAMTSHEWWTHNCGSETHSVLVHSRE